MIYEPVSKLYSVRKPNHEGLLYVEGCCFGVSDVSYLDNDTYRMLIPTAWIPLVDATEENGCLEVSGGGACAWTESKTLGNYK